MCDTVFREPPSSELSKNVSIFGAANTKVTHGGVRVFGKVSRIGSHLKKRLFPSVFAVAMARALLLRS